MTHLPLNKLPMFIGQGVPEISVWTNKHTQVEDLFKKWSLMIFFVYILICFFISGTSYFDPSYEIQFFIDWFQSIFHILMQRSPSVAPLIRTIQALRFRTFTKHKWAIFPSFDALIWRCQQFDLHRRGIIRPSLIVILKYQNWSRFENLTKTCCIIPDIVDIALVQSVSQHCTH